LARRVRIIFARGHPFGDAGASFVGLALQFFDALDALGAVHHVHHVTPETKATCSTGSAVHIAQAPRSFRRRPIESVWNNDRTGTAGEGVPPVMFCGVASS